MSENLRVDIFSKLSLHQSLVKRKFIHCDFQDVSRTRVACYKKVSLQKDSVDSYTKVLGEKDVKRIQKEEIG